MYKMDTLEKHSDAYLAFAPTDCTNICFNKDHLHNSIKG